MLQADGSRDGGEQRIVAMKGGGGKSVELNRQYELPGQNCS